MISTIRPDATSDGGAVMPLENLRVRGVTRLITPAQIKEQHPAEERHIEVVRRSRNAARSILSGTDSRLLLVVGPCSIHDPVAALEYARRLAGLALEVQDHIFVVMRVYFEKPRTTVGWKGLINDPTLDETCDVAKGLGLARELLLQITELGLPAATEFLDPIIPQYIADLVTWAAIGARTTESQTHREMASGLSMPVGFKNGTDGGVQVAIDAMRSACSPHSFLGIDQDGSTSIVKTAGNPDTHVVLRGGRGGPNYDAASVEAASLALEKAGLNPSLMIDCSHANSAKDPLRQEMVWNSILEQRRSGCRRIVGAMMESNLHFGNQPTGPASTLRYGVSITDACIDWENTARIIRTAIG
ncbi:MAG: 3-deoxy-7-phosphoheptulonate synthase [Terrimicrobiaceae bacterium]